MQISLPAPVSDTGSSADLSPPTRPPARPRGGCEPSALPPHPPPHPVHRRPPCDRSAAPSPPFVSTSSAVIQLSPEPPRLPPKGPPWVHLGSLPSTQRSSEKAEETTTLCCLSLQRPPPLNWARPRFLHQVLQARTVWRLPVFPTPHRPPPPPPRDSVSSPVEWAEQQLTSSWWGGPQRRGCREELRNLGSAASPNLRPTSTWAFVFLSCFHGFQFHVPVPFSAGNVICFSGTRLFTCTRWH